MRTPLEVLSGGERGRLMLARALAKPSNLLVLDEPTNDLDLETLDVLEEMLGDYDGTVILISHDRDFLDRVVTSVIVPEGDGRWIEYAGGYTDMLAQRGADLKREAVKPVTVEREKEATAAMPPQPRRSAAQLQRKARAGNPAEDHGEVAGRNRSGSSGILTIPICSRRIARSSIKPLMRLRKRRRNCRRPRTNGWNLKCCAKRSSRPERVFRNSGHRLCDQNTRQKEKHHDHPPRRQNRPRIRHALRRHRHGSRRAQHRADPGRLRRRRRRQPPAYQDPQEPDAGEAADRSRRSRHHLPETRRSRGDG